MSEAFDTDEQVLRLDPEAEHPVLACLEQYRKLLEPALGGSFYTWGDVRRAIAENRATLWPGKASAMVTEDVIYPSGERAMQVWLGGGDLEELLRMAPGVEAAARLRGCTAVLIEGRKGWERPLKAMGYDLWSVTLQKAL